MKAITSKELKAEKEKQKKAKLEAEMKKTYVNTINGKKCLFDLVTSIGVKHKVAYWNYIEVPVKKEECTMNNLTEIRPKTHDYGLIFNDGTEIKHVNISVYNYCKAEIIKKRERLIKKGERL